MTLRGFAIALLALVAACAPVSPSQPALSQPPASTTAAAPQAPIAPTASSEAPALHYNIAGGWDPGSYGPSRAANYCSTQDADCRGRARFMNARAPVACFAIVRASGPRQDFCLRQGEDTHLNDIAPRDEFCWNESAAAPPAGCSSSYVLVERRQN